MNIVRIIERRFARVLGRDLAGRTKATPPAATIRLCQYGHTVFDGNNLCNYGHRPA